MVKNYFKLIVALVFASNVMAQNVPNYVPTNGLVGWWPFNGNANDESGNGNNGTVNGATLTADRNGKANSAYSFDGISNFISISDNENLRLFATDFTLNTWIVIDDLKSNINHIFYKGKSSGDFSKYLFAVNNNKVGFHTNPPASVNYWKLSNSVLPSQNWVMVTVLKSNDKIIFYINGIKDDESLLNYSIPYTYGIPIRIGGAEPNGSGWLKGKIDDITIYNRALTQQEITTLYTGVPPCTNPTAIITPQGNTTFCQGGYVNLNATNGTNYTYQWYNNNQIINGANTKTYQANSSGNYSVKITDGACNATSATITVTVNPLPNVTMNALNNVVYKSSSPIQLVANPSGGIFSGDGVQGTTFNPPLTTLGTKTITYNYTSPQGCSGNAVRSTIVVDSIGNVCGTYDTLKIKVKLTTGINTNQFTSMRVYPNPTSDVLVIDAVDVQTLNGYRYRILDIQGKEVYNALVTTAKTEVSLKTLGAKGMYLLHILDANNESIQTKQIVLE
jgi:hypothetical protein